jgi:hypothetical protein
MYWYKLQIKWGFQKKQEELLEAVFPIESVSRYSIAKTIKKSEWGSESACHAQEILQCVGCGMVASQ